MTRCPHVVGAGLLLWMAMCLAPQAAGAAVCGEPVAAPKHEVGEEWTWKDEKGREWTNRVVGIEGEFALMRWPGEEIAYYDKDWVIPLAWAPSKR